MKSKLCVRAEIILLRLIARSAVFFSLMKYTEDDV